MHLNLVHLYEYWLLGQTKINITYKSVFVLINATSTNMLCEVAPFGYKVIKDTIQNYICLVISSNNVRGQLSSFTQNQKLVVHFIRVNCSTDFNKCIINKIMQHIPHAFTKYVRWIVNKMRYIILIGVNFLQRKLYLYRVITITGNNNTLHRHSRVIIQQVHWLLDNLAHGHLFEMC